MVEFYNFPIISVSLSVLALALTLKYLRRQSTQKNVPHGSMGWPFLGETLDFLKPHEAKTIGSFLQQHCSRYGKIFKSNLFGFPTIVSCDYEFNMFILQNEGKLVEVDYPKAIQNISGKLSLFVVTGDLHKKLRSIAVNFANASKSESTFLNYVQMLALSILNSWQNSTQIAFYQEAKKFTINTLLKHLLSINPNEPLASKILDNFENYLKGFVSLPLNIPGTTYSNAVKARKRLSSIVKEMIMERRKGHNVGHVEEGDFLNVIMSKPNLCEEEMVSIVLDLLFGGYETTSKLLSLCVYYLGQSPKSLERLKEEHHMIRKNKIDGEPLNWEDYKQMEFTRNVVVEASRCGNVAKNLFKKATQDVKFKEFVIPAGWKILPILSAAHLDPTIYENPWEFNPFRWNDSSCKKVASFGGGSRLCPGVDLAKVEISFFLYHLILNYRWKIKADDYPLALPYVEFTKGLLLDLEPIN